MKTIITIVFNCIVIITIAQDIKVLDLQANDLVYASNIDRIYFIGSLESDKEDSLCILNPYNGLVEDCYYIGNNPMTMAISTNEQYIYIGLRGLPRVVRFNRGSETIDDDFSLGGDFVFGNYYAEDIEVFPDDPFSIAVARRIFTMLPYDAGVAIFKNGIMEPNIVSSDWQNRSISFAIGNKTLYGYYSNDSFNDGLNKMTIDDDGIQLDTFYKELFTISNEQIEYSNGVLYSRRGQAVDVTTEHPTFLGNYDLGEYTSYGAVEPADSLDRIYFGTHSFGDPYYVKIFNKSTFDFLGEFEIPLTGSNGEFYDIIKWGDDSKLAINIKNATAIPSDGVTPGHRIVIIDNAPVSNQNISHSDLHQFKVYPNPTIDNFIIKSSSITGTVSIKLFNHLGKEIENWNNINLTNSPSFSLKNYSTGIYFIQIFNDKNQIIGINKVIKP
jgi:plasmid maintenance system antidote protein VapI